MILLVSLALDHPSLQDFEYVRPIEKEVRRAGGEPHVVHMSEITPNLLDEADGVILCGTAVGDNAVLERTDRFDWLMDNERPVLGICIGANLICLAHGGGVEESVEFGHVKVAMESASDGTILDGMERDEVYCTHVKAPVLPAGFTPLMRSDGCVEAFRKDGTDTYGILFHPEVRHGLIIGNFCDITRTRSPGAD